MPLRSVSLDVDFVVLLSSKLQQQPRQIIILVHAERAIAIVCSHDHALMHYAALSLGPSKSP
jgi:hypothetical protein